MKYWANPRAEKLQQELLKLTLEQVESKVQTFGGVDEKALRGEEVRLKRIREVTNHFISALRDERN